MKVVSCGDPFFVLSPLFFVLSNETTYENRASEEKEQSTKNKAQRTADY